MKIRNIFNKFILLVLMFNLLVFSCKKPIDEFPNTNEVISFAGIDSTTVFKHSGETLDFDVVIVTDTIVDTLRIGYLIDTIGIVNNIEYAQIDTEAIVTGFTEINNRQIYNASIKLPTNVYGLRAFRPFNNNVGDFVRIIFRVEAGSKTYEKQLKVIMEP